MFGVVGPPGFDASRQTASSWATVRALVTAIIPTRNRAHCLPRAIESICAQEGRGDLFDVEIIVVDDASTDTTPEVVRSYDAVRYVRLPEKRGVAAAMNEGLRAGDGRYVSFLGDDDEWCPHKLRVQLPPLEAQPDVGVVYGQFLARMDGQEWLFPEVARAPSGWVFAAMLFHRFASHHAALLARREAFDQAGPFDESLASYEDHDMSLRLALLVPFLFVPGPVTVYNLSPRGLWLTRAASGEGATDAARVAERALQQLPDTARGRALAQEARAWLAFDAANPFAVIGDSEHLWARTLGALRAHPWVLRRTWARDTAMSVIRSLVLKSADAESTAARLCAEVEAASRGSGMATRWHARRLLARVWVDVAYFSTFGPLTLNGPGLARAVGRAVAYAPSCLWQRRLVRVAIRRLLGRRVEGFCMAAIKRRVRTTVSQTATQALGVLPDQGRNDPA